MHIIDIQPHCCGDLRPDLADRHFVDSGVMDAPEILPLGGLRSTPWLTGADKGMYFWGYITSRAMDVDVYPDRGPAGENGVVAGVVAPAAPGQRVRTPKPRKPASKPDGCNLDRTGMRLVGKGAIVVCLGSPAYRWLVIKVNRGSCWVRDPWHGSRDFAVRCSSVLVVPS